MLTFAVVLSLWQVTTMLGLLPAFILPPPLEVAETFARVVSSGFLMTHISATLQAMVIGLLFGAGIGALLGYLIAHNPWLEAALSPLIVALQATPVIAYAPLLIIWFGTGLTSKVVTCAVVVFFPTLVNTLVGVRQVPRSLRDVFRVMRASRWQTFRQLEVPAALPVLLAGLKTSATLSLIGAVVGEFVAARAGLGFMVLLARNQFDTPLVFVGILTMTALALGFYGIVSLMERLLLRWQPAKDI